MPTLSPATAARLGCAAVAALVLLGSPALAAGTGGIEVTPIPGVVDGEPVTAFRVEVPSRGTEQVPYLLRNVEDGERSARIYTARVTRDDAGTLSLGEPGSSPYVSLPPQDVTLQEGEAREETFTVQGGEPPGEDELAAVVVEVRNGSVVQRASTLIYFEKGRVVPLPLVLVLVAVALVTTAAVALASVGRRRRAAAEASEPAPAA